LAVFAKLPNQKDRFLLFVIFHDARWSLAVFAKLLNQKDCILIFLITLHSQCTDPPFNQLEFGCSCQTPESKNRILIF
jgi:hypothetical protein